FHGAFQRFHVGSIGAWSARRAGRTELAVLALDDAHRRVRRTGWTREVRTRADVGEDLLALHRERVLDGDPNGALFAHLELEVRGLGRAVLVVPAVLAIDVPAVAEAEARGCNQRIRACPLVDVLANAR